MFLNGQEIKILMSGTEVIGFKSRAQILVESGSRVRRWLGTLGMGKNYKKLFISRVGARVMVHKVLN